MSSPGVTAVAGSSAVPLVPLSADAPSRPLTIRATLGWGFAAAAGFHLAYASYPFFFILFLAGMYQLACAATRQQAMYSGWVLGLLIYGPQLAFFWSIFGFAATALWLVLGTWLSIYLVLQRFALLKLGPRLAALAAPFIWTGLEYFRSELYYLRFSWLNAGYAFAPSAPATLLSWFGMYGAGFLLMLVAAQCLSCVSLSRRSIWACAALAFMFGGAWLNRSAPSGPALKVAGVQLEFADERTIIEKLNDLREKCPDGQLFVLSEYTFEGPVPAAVKEWCARHQKYLIAGGKDYLDVAQSAFANTAFVIGPDGAEAFSQVKAVPIQFFKDGQAATAQKVWDSPWGKLGLCVCYDLSYTRVTDRLVRQGAQAIIVPTMDVEDWGERQHRLHARVAPVRAAEYGVPIFRLCSSGISQAVSAQGSVIGTAPFPGQGETLEATLEIPRKGGRLPFDRILVWPCLAVCAWLLAWALFNSIRPKTPAQPPSVL